jgi:hypothetical protein
MTAYLDRRYTLNGVEICMCSRSEIKEMVAMFPYYRFPVGTGYYMPIEGIRVWPVQADDWEPLDYSQQFEWGAIDV